MVRLGLTGGIGSGKTTVAGLFAELGAGLVDADALSREVTAPGGEAVAALAHCFGTGVLAPDGGLDRARMRTLVFADTDKRRRLEAIIHPVIAKKMSQQTLAARDMGLCLLVYDIPLLVESPQWRQRLDRVLVIDCDPAIQIARVSARSGLEATEIERIIAAQAPRTTRLRAADLVIDNTALAMAQLRTLVGQLAQRFGLSLATPATMGIKTA